MKKYGKSFFVYCIYFFFKKYEEQSRYSKLEATKKFANELNTLQRENKQLEMKLKKSAERSSENTRQLQKMLADQQRLTAR